MKYAEFNKDGLPLGFYSLDVNGSNIPKGAIKINDDQWQEFIDNNGLRKWNGEKVVHYKPVFSKKYLKDIRAEEIKLELNEIDKKSLRPLRTGDNDFLSKLEKQAENLRKELSNL